MQPQCRGESRRVKNQTFHTSVGNFFRIPGTIIFHGARCRSKVTRRGDFSLLACQSSAPIMPGPLSASLNFHRTISPSRVDGRADILAFSVNRASRLKGTRHIINAKSETKIREGSDATLARSVLLNYTPSIARYAVVEPVWLILN